MLMVFHVDNKPRLRSVNIFIETQRPLLVGDEIIMTFRLQGLDKPLKLRGEIAHATRSGVGVEFKDVSPYIEELLRTAIKGMN